MWVSPTHQWRAVCPAEVVLNRPVVQADPLVILSVCCGGRERRERDLPPLSDRAPSVLTVNKVLLLWSDDAGQMCVEVAAALLCLQPRLSVREVQVAVPLKLSPAFFTLLLICSRNSKQATLFNIWPRDLAACHLVTCDCSTL